MSDANTPRPTSEDVLLSSAQVRRRMGNVSAMTLWRWRDSREMNFPAPIVLNKRNYWKDRELQRWIETKRRIDPTDPAAVGGGAR